MMSYIKNDRPPCRPSHDEARLQLPTRLPKLPGLRPHALRVNKKFLVTRRAWGMTPSNLAALAAWLYGRWHDTGGLGKGAVQTMSMAPSSLGDGCALQVRDWGTYSNPNNQSKKHCDWHVAHWVQFGGSGREHWSQDGIALDAQFSMWAPTAKCRISQTQCVPNLDKCHKPITKPRSDTLWIGMAPGVRAFVICTHLSQHLSIGMPNHETKHNSNAVSVLQSDNISTSFSNCIKKH